MSESLEMTISRYLEFGMSAEQLKELVKSWPIWHEGVDESLCKMIDKQAIVLHNRKVFTTVEPTRYVNTYANVQKPYKTRQKKVRRGSNITPKKKKRR